MAWSVLRRQGDDGQGEGIARTEGKRCPAYNMALSRQGKEQGQCYGIMGGGQEPGEFHLGLSGARWLSLSPSQSLPPPTGCSLLQSLPPSLVISDDHMAAPAPSLCLACRD